MSRRVPAARQILPIFRAADPMLDCTDRCDSTLVAAEGTKLDLPNSRRRCLERVTACSDRGLRVGYASIIWFRVFRVIVMHRETGGKRICTRRPDVAGMGIDAENDQARAAARI